MSNSDDIQKAKEMLLNPPQLDKLSDEELGQYRVDLLEAVKSSAASEVSSDVIKERITSALEETYKRSGKSPEEIKATLDAHK